MFKKILFSFFTLAVALVSLSIWGCLPDVDTSMQASDPQAVSSCGAIVPSHDNFSFFHRPPVIVDRADTVLALNRVDESFCGGSVENGREYPYASLAGALLGLRGKHGQGLYGIEYLCDSFAAKGMRNIFSQGAKENMLALTISKDIQVWAENDLKRQMKRLKAETGALVMMDISNGEILAMASMPEWNPQNAWGGSGREFVNHAIEDELDAWMFLPMMEWLRLYTVAYTNASLINDGKTDHPAGDALGAGDAALDRETLFARSGRRKWSWGNITGDLVLWSPWDHDIMKQFSFYPSEVRDMWKIGLGQDTGIELSREKSGSLPTIMPANWDGVAFNSVKATPVQMLRAFSAIINAGSVVELMITKAPSGRQGEKTLKNTGVDWLTDDSSEWMRKELALDDGPSIAAIKIGTAESSTHAVGGGCAQVVSLGFWPEENPRIAYITVLGNTAFDPRVKRGTLGKTIRTVKKAWGLLEEELKPDVRTAALPSMKISGAREKNSRIMPDLRGVTMRQAIRAAMNVGLVTMVRGSGTVTEQYPAPGASINGMDKCTIICSAWAGLT